MKQFGFLAFSMERRCFPYLSLSWRLVSPMYCMLHMFIAPDHANEIGR